MSSELHTGRPGRVEERRVYRPKPSARFAELVTREALRKKHDSPVSELQIADDQEVDWWDKAECRDAPNPNIFDASGRVERKLKDDDQDPDAEKRIEIKRRKEVIAQYCAKCAVKQVCLQDAVDTDDHHTIRGGTTPDQRKGMKAFGLRVVG